MPCPPEMACQAICRSGKRCSRIGNHETKLCGLHTIVENTCQGQEHLRNHACCCF